MFIIHRETDNIGRKCSTLTLKEWISVNFPKEYYGSDRMKINLARSRKR